MVESAVRCDDKRAGHGVVCRAIRSTIHSAIRRATYSMPRSAIRRHESGKTQGVGLRAVIIAGAQHHAGIAGRVRVGRG